MTYNKILHTNTGVITIGQAKLRGTFDERKEKAEQKAELDKLLREYLALSPEERLRKFVK